MHEQKLISMLKDLLDLCKNSDLSSGHCMCGDGKESHGYGMIEHSYTDSGWYIADQTIERIESELKEIEKNMQKKENGWLTINFD